MKRIMHHGFTLLLIIAFAAALYASKGWNSTTALFPRAVGFPMLALLIAIFVVDILKERRQKEDGKTDGEGEMKFSVATGLSLLYLGWLAGFIVLAWAIGLIYSIPVYVFSYMKVQGKYGFLKSGLYAVAATVFVLIFGYFFKMAWPEGVLVSFFDR